MKEPVITPEDLVPYVGQALVEVQQAVADAKRKHPHMKLSKTWDTLDKKMGADVWNPMHYASEYLLIRQKKSTLSAEMRSAVQMIGDRAMQLLIADTIGYVEKKETLKRNIIGAAIVITLMVAALGAAYIYLF